MRSRSPRGSHLPMVRIAGILALATVLVVTPTALAAGPVRTVTHPTAPILYPAGYVCAFDVQAQPVHATVTTITFANGTTITTVVSNPILSNLATGKSIVWHPRFIVVETYDAAANTFTDVIIGQFNLILSPGDQGPYGVVTAPGLFRTVVGEVRLTYDGDTGVVTHLSLHGVVTGDICAELSA